VNYSRPSGASILFDIRPGSPACETTGASQSVHFVNGVPYTYQNGMAIFSHPPGSVGLAASPQIVPVVSLLYDAIRCIRRQTDCDVSQLSRVFSFSILYIQCHPIFFHFTAFAVINQYFKVLMSNLLDKQFLNVVSVTVIVQCFYI
jgi:hypothetical protein